MDVMIAIRKRETDGVRRVLTASAVALVVIARLVAPGPAAAAVVGCSGTIGDAIGLVNAITEANVVTGPDTIELVAGCTYTLTKPDNYWYGPNGLPPIASDITLEGNGATIARAGSRPFRLLFVGADWANADTPGYVSPGPGVLTLRDVTLTDGLAQGGDSNGGGGGAGMGGAIFNQGTATVEDSTLARNVALGGSANVTQRLGNGGGIGAGSAGFGWENPPAGAPTGADPNGDPLYPLRGRRWRWRLRDLRERRREERWRDPERPGWRGDGRHARRRQWQWWPRRRCRQQHRRWPRRRLRAGRP